MALKHTSFSTNEGAMMDDIRNTMRDMGRQYGEQMREQARERAEKRKAEYLGARVPAALREKVIARAEALGIPVSDLIREILEQAFAGAPEVRPPAPTMTTPSVDAPAKPVNYSGIIGWETITLNQARACTACGVPLMPGQEVTFGLALDGSDHAILCRKCRPNPVR